MRRVRLALCCIATLIAAVPGGAEEGGPFVLLDRTTASTRVGADLSLVFPRSIDVYGIRLDFNGQWIHRWNFGGYVQIGWTHVINQGVTLRDLDPSFGVPPRKINDPTASNNLEIGALYALRLRPLSVAFRVGLMLATSPSDWNALANLFSFGGRLSDLEQFLPSMDWLRIGAVITGGDTRFFYQSDLSVSFGFPTSEYAEEMRMVHVNGGAGTSLGPISVFGEVVNTRVSNGYVSSWYRAMAFGLRYRGWSVSPHVSYILPFDFDDGVIGQAFLVGVAYIPDRSRN